MLTRIKIYFQLLVNRSVSKTSETTNRMIFTETKILVHFYRKFQDIIIIFHDFPWPWLFSMTFQAWKIVLLNSMTFQEESSPCNMYSQWAGVVHANRKTGEALSTKIYSGEKPTQITSYFAVTFRNCQKCDIILLSTVSELDISRLVSHVTHINDVFWK